MVTEVFGNFNNIWKIQSYGKCKSSFLERVEN